MHRTRYELLAVPAPPAPRPVEVRAPRRRIGFAALVGLGLAALVMMHVVDRLTEPAAAATGAVPVAAEEPGVWHAPRHAAIGRAETPRWSHVRPARLTAPSTPSRQWRVELAEVDGAQALVALGPVAPPGRALHLRYGDREVAMRAGVRRGRTVVLRAAVGQRFPPGRYLLADREGAALARLVLGGDGADRRLASALRTRFAGLAGELAAGRDAGSVGRAYRRVVGPWRLCPAPEARERLLGLIDAAQARQAVVR